MTYSKTKNRGTNDPSDAQHAAPLNKNAAHGTTEGECRND
jgi:hypothetical protein